MNDAAKSDHRTEIEIAVIGMSGRFPGARNTEQLWKNIRDGVESISFFSDQELEEAYGFRPSCIDWPNFVKAGAALDDVDKFDASFFGYNPREAELMDPQHRFFLECAWEALEDAGYDPERYAGPIGVYAGAGADAYLTFNILPNKELVRTVGEFQLSIGNTKDHLPTSASYKLNLKGPSVNVQATCSTSLVATHLACQGLLSGECDMALAGGVSISAIQKSGYLYEPGGIFSPDGHCRAFDADAKGIVSGSGVGIVVLKRLSDALRDGDSIRAIIKGSAINNDGSKKVGYTAPSIEGQARVIRAALLMAEVDPETISYIEAHGTGTPMGDPIEVAALKQAFQDCRNENKFCAIGSIKTNIGHLDSAAGAAGLIKTILALSNKQLPPSLGFRRPNPEIDFDNSPFYVNTSLKNWERQGAPRRAGVSSFGIGGTNAHIVLEEAPLIASSTMSRNERLIIISARTAEALQTSRLNLATHLRQHPELNLADVAYTLQVGRRPFGWRRMFVCENREDAISALEGESPAKVWDSFVDAPKSKVVFMFPGVSSQYVNMGRDLYETEPDFRGEVDRCCALLNDQLNCDAQKLLFPSDSLAEDAASELEKPSAAMPLLFVVEYALAKLLISWGIRPESMIGHSLGELTAACLAGVFSLEDAIYAAAVRGKLFERHLPKGAMLSVYISAEEIAPLVEGHLSIAAINSPSNCVVSGTKEKVEFVAKLLDEKQIEYRRLRIEAGTHSELVDAIVKQFEESLSPLRLEKPVIPFISSLTGTWISDEEATSPAYWARQLRNTVRFADGAEQVLKEPARALLEIGPGGGLTTLMKRQKGYTRNHVLIPAMRRMHEPQTDTAFLLTALGKLWLSGVGVEWERLSRDEQLHRIPLPTYPFERQRYWISQRSPSPSDETSREVIKKESDAERWLYAPVWKQSLPLMSEGRSRLNNQPQSWLIFLDEMGVGSGIVDLLTAQQQSVITVLAGAEFAEVGDQSFVINPQEREDYFRLIGRLESTGRLPQLMVHLWNIAPDIEPESVMDNISNAHNIGFGSILNVTQAIGAIEQSAPINLAIVTSNLQAVTGEEPLQPQKAALLGIAKVISQEYPHVSCRVIDVLVPDSEYKKKKISRQLIAEVTSGARAALVAYRGQHRWVEEYENAQIDEEMEDRSPLRERGIYVIVGGLGFIGFLIAGQLALTYKSRLALITRSPFPSPDDWDLWLETRGASDSVSQKILQLREWMTAGAEVMIISADVSDKGQMRQAIAQILSRFGRINGVIHAAVVSEQDTYCQIQDMDSPHYSAHFRPKIQGALILEEVLRGIELDFCHLFSSASSILGGLGMAAYAAANAFQDSFARLQRQRGLPWTSINWDWWKREEHSQNADGFHNRLLSMAIAPGEGIQLFQRILCLNQIPQVIVSTGNLKARAFQSLNGGKQDEKQKGDGRLPTSSHQRPDLKTPYAPAGNAIEERIVSIWREELNISSIGVRDDFFELGGHSLLAVRLFSRLRREFQVELSLEAFFRSPTVSDLAVAIVQAQAKEIDIEAVNEILLELEGKQGAEK